MTPKIRRRSRALDKGKVFSALAALVASGWAMRRTYAENSPPPCVEKSTTSPDMATDGDFWRRFIAGGKVPSTPFPDQRKAPCRGSTVSINGGCWVKTADKPTCPDDQYEHGGGCYFPVTGSKSPNASESK